MEKRIMSKPISGKFVAILFGMWIFILGYGNLADASLVTFQKEYSYQASEADSKLSSRAIALEQVKRLLLGELGTYLERETEVKNFQLTKDQIVILIAGIVRAEIIDDRWDGKIYYLKTKIVTDPKEVIKSIDLLRQDRQKAKELEETRKRADEALREIKRLKKELEIAKAEKPNFSQYIKEVNVLSATDFFQEGYGLAIVGRYQEAMEAYTKAIERDPKFAMAYTNRGISYSNLGDHRQAVEDLKIAAKLGNKWAQEFFGERRAADDNRENSSQAIKAFNKVPEQDLKKDAKSYFVRGLAYYETGKYQEAIGDYDKAIELDSKLVEAYVNRGGAYWMLGNSKQAIEDYKIAAGLGHKKSQEFLRLQGAESDKVQGEQRGEKKQIASLPPAPPSAMASEREVRQFLDSYVECYNWKDLEGIIASFSDRAIQNRRDDLGKIKKSYETFFDQMETVQYRITIDKIERQQNSIEVKGQYQLEGIVLKGRKKENWKGQVRWVLVREDSVLKILTLDYQPQSSK